MPDGAPHPTASIWRAKWGCDTPLEASPWRVVCDHCGGLGCEGCGFGGELPVPRCPRAVAIPECAPALGWALTNIDQQRLPVAGGMLDQASAFVATLAIVEGELGRINEEMRKRMQNRDTDLDGNG